jgi:hypothetical protein
MSSPDFLTVVFPRSGYCDEMHPAVWGPSLWKAIHCIAMGYPTDASPTDRDNYRRFFENLHQVLPCGQCADHYREHLKQEPLDDAALRDARALFDWTVRMHNRANAALGKREVEPAAAWATYSAMASRGASFVDAHVKSDARAVGSVALLAIFALALIWVWRRSGRRPSMRGGAAAISASTGRWR